ncbi:MAG: MraY family glycosyltransferase [Candidatus Omnitrophota bacterium]|jgi:UDP-GlcNAc:undecaprenyl-phosphate GlcNAc-1-phosphate transferase
MLINYLFILLIGFLTGSFFVFLLRKAALKYNLLISQGMPLVGGTAMWLSFVIASLAGFSFSGRLTGEAAAIIISSLLMLIFGIIDDWRELSILAKFLAQIIAASFLIFFGVRTRIVYIGDPLNIIITFIWIIGITNAFNHLDIIDGLASLAAIIISSGFFIIALLNKDINSAILSLALIAAGSGFLIYNFPPAKAYMGNSGSHFLGFVLATVALLISYAPMERKIALLSPILILGLPIFDTAFLVLIRLGKKRLPFKKSNDHLILRFLALGYSKKKALFAMLGLCLFFSLCGIMLSQVSNLFGGLIVISAILVSLCITFYMGRVSINE